MGSGVPERRLVSFLAEFNLLVLGITGNPMVQSIIILIQRGSKSLTRERSQARSLCDKPGKPNKPRLYGCAWPVFHVSAGNLPFIHWSSRMHVLNDSPNMETPLQANNSPPTSVEEIPPLQRKRRRKVLSCLNCRSRKLKCDRNLPSCARCQKGGQEDTCTYDSKISGDMNDERRQTKVSSRKPGSPSLAPVVPTASGMNESMADPQGSSLSDSHRIIREQIQRITQLERRIACLQGLTRPNGMHFRCFYNCHCSLYEPSTLPCN